MIRWIALGTVSILLVTLLAAKGGAAAIDMTPLTDLGSGLYRGFMGGLYPGGQNRPPEEYLEMGMQQARLVQPLSIRGEPDADGRIVLLSIGMSNTTQEFSVFKYLADRDWAKNPRLVIVDGAQGAQDAAKIRNAHSDYWRQVDLRLERAGVHPAQVQVVWIKQAIASERRDFPANAVALQEALKNIVGILQQRFVNLRIVYLSSRTYAGYATTPLNPEPHAYEGGFAVKWLIEEHIKRMSTPWVAWGPYLWTNGTKGRAIDDLVWERRDTREDGTHPSRSGALKVGELLLRFLKTDETAKPWFLGP